MGPFMIVNGKVLFEILNEVSSGIFMFLHTTYARNS